MNVVRIVLQLVLIALGIFGIGTLMEVYKKKIRKDQAKVWEIRLISGALSIGVAVAYKVTGLFTPVISAIFTNVTPWVDVALYAVVIFFGQLEADMKTVKDLIKLSTNAVINNKEAVKVELDKFLLDFNAKTKVNINLVVNLLKVVGVTEKTIEGYLKEVGVEDGKAAIIIEAFKESLPK